MNAVRCGNAMNDASSDHSTSGKSMDNATLHPSSQFNLSGKWWFCILILLSPISTLKVLIKVFCWTEEFVSMKFFKSLGLFKNKFVSLEHNLITNEVLMQCCFDSIYHGGKIDGGWMDGWMDG